MKIAIAISWLIMGVWNFFEHQSAEGLICFGIANMYVIASEILKAIENKSKIEENKE